MFLLRLFGFKTVCNHEKVAINLDFSYCPDCGKLIRNEWYITRCACCGVKERATIRNDEVVPEDEELFYKYFILNENFNRVYTKNGRLQD
jgi:hypothetical protein